MWGFNTIVNCDIGAGSGGVSRSPLRQIMLISIMLATVALAGCAQFKALVGGVEENPALRSAVEEGISTLVEENPGYTDQILKVMDEVRGFWKANPGANASQLVDIARDEVNQRYSDLTENEQIAIDATLQISERIIAKRIEQGDLKADAEATVGQYFTWIENIAKEAQRKRTSDSG